MSIVSKHGLVRRVAAIALGVAAAVTVAGSLPARAAAPGVNSAASIADFARQHQGTRISANEVAFNGGKVVMTFPKAGSTRALAAGERAAAAGTANCRTQYTCLYEHANFDGRRLEFYYCDQTSLVPYGFYDKASSWHNGQYSLVTRVFNNTSSGLQLLWSEQPRTASSYVGAAANDKADVIDPC